jgi:hypothetical protein
MAFALDPRRCDPEVWKHGTPVLMTHSIPKEYMDDWCSKVSEQAEAQVDWSFAAGRIVVRALGNLERVRKVMRENLKELAAHQRDHQCARWGETEPFEFRYEMF